VFIAISSIGDGSAKMPLASVLDSNYGVIYSHRQK
jgi:hypothetical protein